MASDRSSPLLAAALLAALPCAARGHGGGVLDLEGIETLVVARADETVGATRKHYRELRRVVDREIRRPLVDDLTKIRAVARKCRRHLAGDAELVTLLDAALTEADGVLAGEPEDAAAIAERLERPSDRQRVLGASAHAEATRAVGALRAAADDRLGAAEAFRNAAREVARTESLGARLLRRQIRRGAPGQPLPKGATGTIATYAGTGASGFDPGPRPARGASFYFPSDVALGPDGLLHVADWNNNQIRRLDADGVVRAVAGTGELSDDEPSGPAVDAKLHHPTSIAFHPVTGDLFIAGWHSARVLRVGATTGMIDVAGGTGVLGFDGDDGDARAALLNYPGHIAFAADGTWYLLDQGNRRVRRVDGASGTISTVAGNGDRTFAGDDGPATAASFDLPDNDQDPPEGAVCLDPTGRWLYVADTGNHRVRRIDLDDPQRTITTFAGNGDDGHLGDGSPALAASFRAPVDVECDAAGNVFVCDRDASVVRRIDLAAGTVTTVAGTGVPGFSGDLGPATAARLDLPQGICIDRVRGRLYVADTNNNVIRVVWE